MCVGFAGQKVVNVKNQEVIKNLKDAPCAKRGDTAKRYAYFKSGSLGKVVGGGMDVKQ